MLMNNWYVTEIRIRRWAEKPMSTLTQIVTGTMVVFIFGLMIYLSI